jgi:hypothetical protein
MINMAQSQRLLCARNFQPFKHHSFSALRSHARSIKICCNAPVAAPAPLKAPVSSTATQVRNAACRDTPPGLTDTCLTTGESEVCAISNREPARRRCSYCFVQLAVRQEDGRQARASVSTTSHFCPICSIKRATYNKHRPMSAAGWRTRTRHARPRPQKRP